MPPNVVNSVDGLSRLTRTEEGTWNGSAITSRARDEQWTLTRTGNWNRNKLDLNGDGDFTDAGEQDDTQAFNDANELLTRDTDSNAAVDLTLAHDAVGNLTDDGKSYTYEYDAFGRMVRMKNRLTPFATVNEYKYNGLGHRVSWRYLADPDLSFANQPWYHFAYDESWRIVALYRGADTSPKEIFINHQPGRNGVRGASGIAAGLDAVILRDKDANSTWSSASDGSREERVYYCQNWRGDVVALLGTTAGAAGMIVERVSYSAYGVPQGFPAGDINNDGSADTADDTLWYTLSAGAYDVRADFDLDGDMDWSDEILMAVATTRGLVHVRGIMTQDNGLDYAVGNRKGYAGYEHDGVFNTMCHVRNRVLMTDLGRWSRRDPLGYVDGMGLYEYARAMPITLVDSHGSSSHLPILIPSGPPLTRPTLTPDSEPTWEPEIWYPKPYQRRIGGPGCVMYEDCGDEDETTVLSVNPTSPIGSGSAYPGDCRGTCGVWTRTRTCKRFVCYTTISCGPAGQTNRRIVTEHCYTSDNDPELGTVASLPNCPGQCACISNSSNLQACYNLW